MTQFSISLAVLSTATILLFLGKHIDREKNKKGTITYISYILFFVGIVWLTSSIKITTV